jgi:hypothetical protein
MAQCNAKILGKQLWLYSYVACAIIVPILIILFLIFLLTSIHDVELL